MIATAERTQHMFGVGDRVRVLRHAEALDTAALTIRDGGEPVTVMQVLEADDCPTFYVVRSDSGLEASFEDLEVVSMYDRRTTERTPTAPTVASIVAHMHRIDAHTDPYVPAVVRFTAFMTAVDWYYGTAVWNAAWMQYQREMAEAR